MANVQQTFQILTLLSNKSKILGRIVLDMLIGDYKQVTTAA